jgi:hypothetical protein
MPTSQSSSETSTTFFTELDSTATNIISTSTEYSFLSSSQPISSSQTTMNMLGSTTTELLLETSFVPTSTASASISDTSLDQILSSVEHMNELSTGSIATLDNSSTTSILTTSSNSETDLISSIKLELSSTQLFSETTNHIASTSSRNIVNTIEDITNSNEKSTASSISPKQVTSTDTFTASFLPDSDTTTKIAAFDSSFNPNFKTDDSTSKLSQDQTFVPTNNPTEASTQSSMSYNTDRISTTLENLDKLSTLLTTSVKVDETSMFISTSTVSSNSQPAVEIDTTINSVASTARLPDIESSVSSSVESSPELTASFDIVTPSPLAHTSTNTFISSTDASIIENSIINDNTMTVSKDRTLSNYEATSIESTLSTVLLTAYQTLSEITVATSSQSLESESTSAVNSPRTTSQSLSQTSTTFLPEMDTTTANIISSASDDSLVFSPQPVSTSDTAINILNTATTEFSVEASFVRTSTAVGSSSDTSLDHILSSVEHMNELSTASVATLDNSSTTSIFTTSPDSESDLISSIKLQLPTTPVLSETSDEISSITGTNTLNTIEYTTNLNEYSASSSASPKQITSTDTFTFSLLPDIDTTTKTATIDSSFYLNFKTDDTTTRLSQDDTLVSTNNPTEPPTQSAMSYNTDRISTSFGNVDKLSTLLTSTLNDDRASMLNPSASVSSNIQPSSEMDTTIASVPSTARALDIESTLTASMHSYPELTTSIVVLTPSSSTNTSTDTSIIQNSMTNDDTMTISNDHTLSAAETTSIVSTLSTVSSSTYQMSSQITLTTSNQDVDTESTSAMRSQTTTIQSLSPTSATFVTDMDTTTTNILSSQSDTLSLSHLSSEQMFSTDITTATSISVDSLNLITSTFDTSLDQTVTTINNSSNPLTLSLLVSETDEVTTEEIATSSASSETSTNGIDVQTNRVSSSTADNNDLFTSSMNSSGTTETKSSLLMSSEEVSNTDTITTTSTNAMNVIRTTTEIFEYKSSSAFNSENKTTILPEISTYLHEESTLVTGPIVISDRSTTPQTVFGTTSSSIQSLTSAQISTGRRDTTFVTSIDSSASSLLTDIDTSTKISPIESSFYLNFKTNDTTTMLSQDQTFVSTNNPTESSTESSMSFNSDGILTTFENLDKVSTLFTTTLNNDRTSMFIPSSTVSSEIHSSIETDTTINPVTSTIPSLDIESTQGDIVLSSNAVTTSFTVEDTSTLPTKVESSTLENSKINATSSASPESVLITTPEMIYDLSTIATVATNSDQSSMLTSVLSNNTTSTAEFTTSSNIELNSSQTNFAVSSESDSIRTSDTTSINSFTTVELVSNSVENLSETSADVVSITNPTGTSFQSSTVSSTISSSSQILSTLDITFQNPTSTAQTIINAQSSLFTATTDSTIRLDTTTSINPLTSEDNLTSLSSQNGIYIETSASSMKDSMPSSTANSFTEEVIISTNSIIQSSQSNSEIETSILDTKQSTSNLDLSLDHSTSSQSVESTNERTDSFTIASTQSTAFSQNSHGMSEQTTFAIASSLSTSSSDQTSLSFLSNTSPLSLVTTTPLIPTAEIFVSTILNSKSILSSTNNLETTTDLNIDQKILSSSQTSSDSITEKINDASESIASSEMSTNNHLSTEVIAHVASSSSKSQILTSDDITSSTDSSPSYSFVESTISFDNTKSTLNSSSSTESLYDLTSTVSTDTTQLTNLSSMSIQLSTQLLSSKPQQDLDTSTMEQSSDLTTSFSNQFSSKQITEQFNFTTMEPENLISSSSDQTFIKTSAQYSTDETLISSLSSKETTQEFTSTILSITSETIEQVSTDSSKSSINQSTSSNTLTTQSAHSTSNMATVFNSEVTDSSSTVYTISTTTSTVSSDDYNSSSHSASVSNDVITTTNGEETGKYISIHLNIKKQFFLLCISR